MWFLSFNDITILISSAPNIYFFPKVTLILEVSEVWSNWHYFAVALYEIHTYLQTNHIGFHMSAEYRTKIRSFSKKNSKRSIFLCLFCLNSLSAFGKAITGNLLSHFFLLDIYYLETHFDWFFCLSCHLNETIFRIALTTVTFTNGHFGWWPDIPLQNGTSFSEISLIKFLNVLKMHTTDAKLQFFLLFSNWLLLHTNAHTCTHKINWNKSLSLTKTVAK